MCAAVPTALVYAASVALLISAPLAAAVALPLPCGSGVVPGVPEANKHEPLLPWGRYHQGRVVLGSRVEAACATPADLQHAAGLYRHEKFILCYRTETKKVSRVRRLLEKRRSRSSKMREFVLQGRVQVQGV